MPVDVVAERADIETRLQAIGLRASSTLTANINPPMAMVGLRTPIEFDSDFDGHAVYRWTISVYVSHVDDAAGQTRLDGYLSQAGATSIKAALDTSTRRVTSITQWGEVTVSNVSYLAAEFEAETFG